jgi:uncharacterized protein (TIGR02466 family)
MTTETTARDAVAVGSLFTTPLVTIEWPDADELNAELAAVVLAEASAVPGGAYRYSNVGGWHSRAAYHAHTNRAVQSLMARIRAVAADVTARMSGEGEPCELSAWANVNRAGDYNLPHNHHCTWAVVYYVRVPPSAGADRRAGTLELLDPRPAATMSPTPGQRQRHFVHPRPGMMLLFPGWLSHMVHPFTGPGERISIACNVSFPGADADERRTQ